MKKNPLVACNIPIEFCSVADYVQDHVPVFKVVADGDFRYPGGKRGCHLVFQCPICRLVIHHGGVYGELGGGDGHRCSHCGCWPHGYFIREVDHETAKLHRPYKSRTIMIPGFEG